MVLPMASSPRLHHGHGFWAVAFAFLVVMGYSAAPTPLYGLYALRDGFGPLTITLVFAAYAFGVMASLFLFGHLSDWYGRRSLLVPALALSAASAVVFLLWRSLPGLLVARVIAGLGVGVVTATATAWLSELHGRHRPDAGTRRAEIVGVAANLGGIGTGPLVAGVLAQWVGGPLTVPYVVFLALLAVSGLLVIGSPETRSSARPMPRYRPQRVAVPRHARAAFFAAAGAALVGFAAFALFTSLAPTFLSNVLGEHSHALSGATAFVVFAASAITQLLLAARARRELVLGGAIGLTAGATITVAALWLSSPSLALFLVGGGVTGAGAGALFKGAVMTVVEIAGDERRAEALAGLVLAGYTGMTVPVIGLGLLTQAVAPRVALLIFAIALVVGVLAGLRPLLRQTGGPATPARAPRQAVPAVTGP